jgi:hypothetical protein
MNNRLDYKQLAQLASQIQPQQTTPAKSLSYCEVLSVVLVILKAMGYITCSWIVPFIPLIIPVVLYAIVLIFGFIKGKFFN